MCKKVNLTLKIYEQQSKSYPSSKCHGLSIIHNTVPGPLLINILQSWGEGDSLSIYTHVLTEQCHHQPPSWAWVPASYWWAELPALNLCTPAAPGSGRKKSVSTQRWARFFFLSPAIAKWASILATHYQCKSAQNSASAHLCYCQSGVKAQIFPSTLQRREATCWILGYCRECVYFGSLPLGANSLQKWWGAKGYEAERIGGRRC